MFYLDPGYLLLMIVTLVISGGAQLYVNSAYKKWSDVRNGMGMTGLQVGQAIVDRTSLGDFVNAPQSIQAAGMAGANGSTIRFQRVGGQLTRSLRSAHAFGEFVGWRGDTAIGGVHGDRGA